MFIKKNFSVCLKSVRPDVNKDPGLSCAHPELVEGSARFILQQVQNERDNKDQNVFRNKVIFSLLCFLFFFTAHPFSYDSVIYTAQNGDIKTADQQMRSIVVNSPDDADVLYDAGVLASQLQNHSQAAAYFNRSAQCAADHNKNLCFRAHYNAGNAYVDTKDLKSALEHYDAALELDPDNEYARHNRDRVADMLNQQEQQKNNDQQDKQDEKNNKDDKDDKNQQDKDKQDQNNQSDDKDDQQKNNDADDNQEGDDQQSDDSSQDGSDQKSQGKQGKGSDQDSKREQGAEQGDTEKDQQDSPHDKKRNGEQKFDKQSERAQNEREKQQGQQHEKAPQEQEKTTSDNSIPSEGKQEQGASGEESDKESDEQLQALKLDPWLQGILNDQELHDKAVNKKLMEARIRQHGGKNGQNCW